MFCPKCGGELPENSAFCAYCGEELQKNKIKNSKKQKINIKVILLIICIFIVIFSALGYIIYSSQPTVKYNKAEEALENENYDKAIKLYTSLGEYLDSTDRLEIAVCRKHYVDGCELYEHGKYDSAIIELEQAEQNEATQEMINKAYYGKAIELVENKKYIEAANAFKESNWYSDSDERILEMGQAILESGDYNTAVAIFENGQNIQNNEYVEYARGMLNFQNEKYDEASKNFNKSGNLFDSKEKYKESTYKLASQLFNEKKYEKAKVCFAQVKDYENATEMHDACNLMLAKEKIENGDLDIAINILKDLPENYSYNGINVSELLKKLNDNSQWVSICGKLKSTSGIAESDSRSRITGNEMGTWSHKIEQGDYSLDLKCYLNDDGTVTVKGDGTLFEFTNWSTIQIGLDYNNKAISFSKTIDANSFGKPIEMDENLTVTFLDGKANVKYIVNEDDSSMSFTYKYKTSITYGK